MSELGVFSYLSAGSRRPATMSLFGHSGGYNLTPSEGRSKLGQARGLQKAIRSVPGADDAVHRVSRVRLLRTTGDSMLGGQWHGRDRRAERSSVCQARLLPVSLLASAVAASLLHGELTSIWARPEQHQWMESPRGLWSKGGKRHSPGKIM